MPRKPSGLVKATFTVGLDTLATLDRLAVRNGWLTEDGQPNRSLAVRRLVEQADTLASPTHRPRPATIPTEPDDEPGPEWDGCD